MNRNDPTFRSVSRPLSKLVLMIPLIVLLVGLQSPGVAYAAAFTVDTTNDTSDANTGDGLCADSNGDCSL